MTKILIVFYLLIIANNLSYSNTILDSLFLELAVVKVDSCKVDMLNRISKEYRFDDPKKAFEYNLRAYNMAKELNYIRGIARSYDLLGTIYRYQNDHTKALDNYYKAEELYIEIKDSLQLVDLYTYIGAVYRICEDEEKALIYNQKSYDLAKKINDYEGLAITSNNLGISYKIMNNDSLALYYYQQAFEINQRINRERGMGYACMNIGNIYLKNYLYEKAKQNYFRSLDYFSIDMYPDGMAIILYNIGNSYSYLEQYDSAKFYLLKSYDLANKYLLLVDKKRAIWKLKENCKSQEKYVEALNYLEEYVKIQDSTLTKNLNKRILELEKRFEFEQALKNQESVLLEKSRKLKINKLQKFILLIILVFVIIISWILVNRKTIRLKYSNEKLTLKNNELISYAMYILQKNDLIHEFRGQLLKLQKKLKLVDNKKVVDEIINSLIFKIAISKDIEGFRDKLREISQEFYNKLEQKYPDLTAKEKQLATLLRLNLSSKQIGVILNNTSRSIDTTRYIIRKKVGLSADDNLAEFFNSI